MLHKTPWSLICPVSCFDALLGEKRAASQGCPPGGSNCQGESINDWVGEAQVKKEERSLAGQMA